MSRIQPALDRARKPSVIFVLNVARPQFGMQTQPDLAFCFPLTEQISRHGVCKSKRHEIDSTTLLPVRQPIACMPDIAVRIEELKLFNFHSFGST
jgi:hypothetical protein